MLKAVTETLTVRLRATDRVARLGGDEFAVLLPHIGRQQAEAMADALGTSIAGTTIQAGGEALFARTSIGLAFIDEEMTDADTMLAEADHAMYASKRAAKAAPALL